MIPTVIQMAVRGPAILCLFGIFVAPMAFAGATPSTLWPLWDQYKLQFLKPEGRIVDWDAGARTTSEAQAYALFFSLVADDRPAFDCILGWTETHLAQDSLADSLPAWLWTPAGAAANGGAIADPNSAADADLWIAYTLIQAGRLWRNPDYTALGRSLAERIAREETVLLPGKGYMLLPGRDGFRTNSGATILNPSYLPPQLLAALSRELPTGPWHSIATTLPELLTPEIGHGFAMDWVAFRADSGFSATVMPPGSPGGSYDAIRVYLWAGMLHPSAAGRQALLQNLSGMEAYLREHPIPPERVAPSGAVIDANAPAGFSAAVIPLLAACQEKQALAQQRARLEQSRNPLTGLYGPGQRYYDQVLTLFSEGWSGGFFSFDPNGQLSVRWKKP
jgi:endo-1,4-beta-D-glucanase Y